MSFLIRVALVVLALYLLWRASARLLRSLGATPQQGKRPADAGRMPSADELVQDPVCKVYVARQEAVVLRDRDSEYFFCSETCRDAFVENRGARKG